MTVLFDPAAAIAVGLCATARTIADGRTTRHPRPCGWCDYPLEDLRRMLDGFEAWADRDPKSGLPHRYEVMAFQGLPAREQAQLVLAAQAFPDETPPEPVTQVGAAVAHDSSDEEEGPVWAT